MLSWKNKFKRVGDYDPETEKIITKSQLHDEETEAREAFVDKFGDDEHEVKRQPKERRRYRASERY